MKEIMYFVDTDNNFLLAYEKSSEFFVIFVPEKKAWEDCNISFSAFKHDYAFREIDREEVAKMTGGCLPEALLSEYLKMICKNSEG